MTDSEAVTAILSRGTISADDVLKLRHMVFWKGVVTETDAEMAFALNDRFAMANDPTAVDPSWPAFFVEALTDYVVLQAQPAGYVSEENAAWLMERITRSGRVERETELELLVKVLERSKQSPQRLVAFALEQVKWGIVDGSGLIGRNRPLPPGTVTEAETELLRRVLFAYGGDGNIAVTRQEAEVLFDINDATADGGNHPAWSDLFVKALANFLMASIGYRVPSRQEALRREAWLDAPTPGIAGFMGQMLAGSLQAVWNAYENGSLDGEPRKADTSGFSFDAAPRVSEEDARWAAARIGQDRRLHQNEVALVKFLRSRDAQLYPKLHPVLACVTDDAAAA